MLISANYVCPSKGIVALEAPEPVRLGRAARVAGSIGVGRLCLPVLEEPLAGATRRKVGFLDGLVRALDAVADGGLAASFVYPAQRVLGLNCIPSYLAKATGDPLADPVFVDGKIRRLEPLDWWSDPFLIQSRLGVFRELLSAVVGHPALREWVILDRALEWPRPSQEEAALVVKSFLAELRDRDEKSAVYLGVGWTEVLDPGLCQSLAGGVDGLRLGGLEKSPEECHIPPGPAGDLLMGAYMTRIGQWLFDRPIQVETGWGLKGKEGDPEVLAEAGVRLSAEGPAGVVWPTLVEPEPGLHGQPPWVFQAGLERMGLLDRGLKPKESVAACLQAILATETRAHAFDSIDVGREEYERDPRMHLPRLWDHFLQQG